MSDETPKKFTLLLVDDNPNNLNLLLNALRNDDYKLLVAKSGEDAIKRAEYALPDLILLDVLMPGIDGFETCKILKSNEKTKDIPVIFMTALTETENKVKGFELGAVDYVTKPIQYEEVILRVKNHLLIQDLKNSLQKKNKELEESLAKERELNKLKSRFIYMASHELKNPLSIILMISSILNKEKDLEKSEINDNLGKIIKATKFISNLLDDVLIATMADGEELKFTPNLLDITKFCKEIADDYQLINQDHKIIFEVKDVNDLVYADEKLLVHILTNIISNCIKYSPKGSEVVFQVSQENNRLVFTFKDNGIGISKEDQQTLFEEFKRGSNVGKISGSGLGLSIVKRCTHLHNGEISIESEPGQGTTTKIFLEYITN
jgi:two-component system sensor histidine kinase/response regulator